MKGYFGHLAQLALGIGSRIEPRIVPAFKADRWEEPVGEVSQLGVPVASNQTEEAPLAPRVHDRLAEVERIETHHRTERSEHVEDAEDGERAVVLSEMRRETENRIEATHNERTRERETLASLLREAKSERFERSSESRFELERNQEFVSRTQSERTVELRSHTERSRSRTKATERTVEEASVAQEAAIEVHIGRIEFRPEPAVPSQKTSRAKPSGVLSLDDYLKRRREGR